MKTRMHPIGDIWSKFPRVVRDLRISCNKQIRLEMEGRETELDKTIIEAIKDPLRHIVPSSVGHGIEQASDRLAMGKLAEGRLLLRAYHEGGQVPQEKEKKGNHRRRSSPRCLFPWPSVPPVLPEAVPRETLREGTLVLGHPHGGVHAEPGVRPLEHPSGLVLVKQHQADEQLGHGAPERLGQPGRIARGPRPEGPIFSEAAVGADHVEMWVPVRASRAPGQATSRPRGRTPVNARIVSERRPLARFAGQSATIQTVMREVVWDGEDNLPVRPGASSVASSHVPRSTLLSWQLKKYRQAREGEGI